MSDVNKSVRNNLTNIIDLPAWQIDAGMQRALATIVTAEQVIARMKSEGFAIFFGGHILTKEHICKLPDGTEVLLEQSGSSVRSWVDIASACYTQKGDGEKPLMSDVDYIRKEFTDAWPAPAHYNAVSVYDEGELTKDMDRPHFSGSAGESQ
jgi:hypothetical protein